MLFESFEGLKSGICHAIGSQRFPNQATRPWRARAWTLCDWRGCETQWGCLDGIKIDGIDNNTITIILLAIDSNTYHSLNDTVAKYSLA